MGLDAVVYKNPDALIASFGPDVLEVDRDTGEVYPRPGIALPVPPDLFIAASRRLGNVSHIGLLREAIGELTGDADWLILTRILYSGTHSGDMIARTEVSRLKEELAQLEKVASGDVAAFVESLKSLVLASESEANPIVFV